MCRCPWHARPGRLRRCALARRAPRPTPADCLRTCCHGCREEGRPPGASGTTSRRWENRHRGPWPEPRHPAARRRARSPGNARCGHAGLDLIPEQQRAASAREAAQLREESTRRRQHATFALDGLDQYGRDAVIQARRHRVQITKGHVHHACQRPEAFAITCLTGSRERAHRAPVEGAFEGDDVITLRLPLPIEVAPGQLEQGLDGLRARVAKEGACEAGALAQVTSQQHVRLVVEVVCHMAQALRLLADGLHHVWMGVAQRRYGDARVQIEVTLARAVPYSPPLSAHEDERRLAVVGVQIGLAQLYEGGLFFDGHYAWLSAFGAGKKTPRALPGYVAWAARSLRRAW